MNESVQARRLTLLGIILQSLHILFGITAIMGVLIAHMRLSSAQNTVYHSQIRWQIVTFWLSFVAYIIAFWLWIHLDQPWLLLLVAAFVIYRLVVSIVHWRQVRAIHRWI